MFDFHNEDCFGGEKSYLIWKRNQRDNQYETLSMQETGRNSPEKLQEVFCESSTETERKVNGFTLFAGFWNQVFDKILCT